MATISELTDLCTIERMIAERRKLQKELATNPNVVLTLRELESNTRWFLAHSIRPD